MKEELRKIIPFLDPKCHLYAEVSISDQQAYCGIPMHYIQKDLGHNMAAHISEKIPMVMQRCTPSMSYCSYGSTQYRAELFVFTEAELFKLVERVQNNTFNSKVSEGVTKELKNVTSKVKAELKQKIDKVLS